MEKSQETPPPYSAYPSAPQNQGAYPPQNYGGYPPQNPAYQQQPGQPMYQPIPGQPQYQHQQYSNVVVQQPMPVVQGPPPQDHMTAAIFVTLCCFWPTGIIAIIKASDARNAQMRGDMASANSYARSAKSMINISIVAGICSIIFAAVIIGIYWGLVLKNINDNNYYD